MYQRRNIKKENTTKWSNERNIEVFDNNKMSIEKNWLDIEIESWSTRKKKLAPNMFTFVTIHIFTFIYAFRTFPVILCLELLCWFEVSVSTLFDSIL